MDERQRFLIERDLFSVIDNHVNDQTAKVLLATILLKLVEQVQSLQEQVELIQKSQPDTLKPTE